MGEEELMDDLMEGQVTEELESSDAERCLTFESGGMVMYMSTSYVIEIINDHSITSLPMVPHYVKGIIN